MKPLITMIGAVALLVSSGLVAYAGDMTCTLSAGSAQSGTTDAGPASATVTFSETDGGLKRDFPLGVYSLKDSGPDQAHFTLLKKDELTKAVQAEIGAFDLLKSQALGFWILRDDETNTPSIYADADKRGDDMHFDKPLFGMPEGTDKGAGTVDVRTASGDVTITIACERN